MTQARVFTTARRYYLGKRYKATEVGDYQLAQVWQTKQEAEPGVPLPSTFPLLTRLAEAGYTTDADLNGATAEELTWAEFSESEAAVILSAYAAL